MSLAAVCLTGIGACVAAEQAFDQSWRQSAGRDEIPAAGIGILPLPSGNSLEVQQTILDERGPRKFTFQTTHATGVELRLLDNLESPVPGRLVEISDVAPAGEPATVRFRGITDSNGIVTGAVAYPAAVTDLRLSLEYDDQIFTFGLETENLITVRRNLRFSQPATQSATGGEPSTAAVQSLASLSDLDGDSTPDAVDDFPEDPTRATRVQHPARGRFTMAYEDLYPRKGDADFNDYVVQARFEEHLNAQGQIVQVKSSYRHVARAAGYKHYLKIKLPESLATSAYRLSRHPYTGGAPVSNVGRVAANRVIPISARSDQTIPARNADRGQEFSGGDLYELEITPDAPANPISQSLPPYDLFIHVQNTGREVHFPGLYTHPDGSDEYLDSDGFPWALAVPVDWRWMLERENIHTAYATFIGWYTSAGNLNRDWYNFPNLDLIFENVTTHYSEAPIGDGEAQIVENLAAVPVRTAACFLPIGHSYAVQLRTTPGSSQLEFAFDRAKMEDAGFPLEFAIFRETVDNAWDRGPDATIMDGSNIVRTNLTESGTYVLAVSSRYLDGEESCPDNAPPGLYVRRNGLDSNPGTPEEPLATPGEAVRRLSSGGTVHIAAGTYDLTEPLIIREDISMLGGYSETSWAVRSASDHLTIIRFDPGFVVGLPLATVQYQGTNVESTALLEGLTIQSHYLPLYVNHWNNLTIRDCRFENYSPTFLPSTWFGVYARKSSQLTLERNTIALPVRSSQVTGLDFNDISGSQFILRQNNFSGGGVEFGVLTAVTVLLAGVDLATIEDNTSTLNPAWVSRGMDLAGDFREMHFHRNVLRGGGNPSNDPTEQGSSNNQLSIRAQSIMTLRATENRIEAGPAARTQAWELLATDGYVEGNYIDAAGHPYALKTVGIQDYSDNLIFANNVVTGGTGKDAVAFTARLAISGRIPRARLYNNTIIARSAGGVDAGHTATGVQMGEAAQPDLRNNIIYFPDFVGGHKICIGELRNDSGSPLAARNNALYGCDIAYFDFQAGCGAGSNCDLSELNAFGANFANNAFADPRFTDLDGAVNNVLLFADNDYSLSGTTPTFVHGGGLDLSAIFNTDLLRTSRTTPWSIGAFERD